MDAKTGVVMKISDREVAATRIISAPRDLVFEAWTRPQHVQYWYGPHHYTLTSCRIDLRPGGSYRYVLHGPDGIDYVFSGVYQEVVPSARVVDTSIYEAMPGHEAVETTTFDEHDGKTQLTARIAFQSAEDLDLWATSGGQEGMAETLNRFEELVAKLSKEQRDIKEFAITHTFAARRELVFKAWTERDRLMQWWGPKDFTMRVAKVDLRPGGVFHYAMLAPDGRQIWGRFVYREINAPERIVFVNSFSDEGGNVTRHPYIQDWPLEMLSTVTFTEHDDETAVEVQWIPINPTTSERKAFEAGHESMQRGWTGTFDRLARYLMAAKESETSEQLRDTRVDVAGNETILTRTIDAPRKRVFKAWTDPKDLAKWFGPHGFTNPVSEMDARPGGSWRLVMRSPEGVEYPVKGTFHDVVAPERLVLTEDWDEHPAEWQELLKKHRGKAEGEPSREALETVTFEELDGKTRLTIRTRFDSIADREAMMKMGMAEGWAQSLERLEQQVKH